MEVLANWYDKASVVIPLLWDWIIKNN
jgi:hypothetical protein